MLKEEERKIAFEKIIGYLRKFKSESAKRYSLSNTNAKERAEAYKVYVATAP